MVVFFRKYDFQGGIFPGGEPPRLSNFKLDILYYFFDNPKNGINFYIILGVFKTTFIKFKKWIGLIKFKFQ